MGQPSPWRTLSEGDDVFNQQGYIEVEVNAEETGSPTTPPPDRMVRLLTAFLDLNGSSRVGAVSCEAPNAVAPGVRRRIGDVFKQGGRRLEALGHIVICQI